MTFAKALRDPLVHFIAMGAALFGLHALLNDDDEERRDQILVTAGQVETLSATFTKIWQRPPTRSELEALIDAHVKEEVFSREAIALGLDRNDTVIRRRLQQKMEFLAEDFAASAPPDESELNAYLSEHADKFMPEPRVTFRQVFLNPEIRPDIELDAARLLEQLNGDQAIDPDELGDPTLLPASMEDEPIRITASQFGTEFAARLITLSTNRWFGPVSSGFGKHLVMLSSRTEPTLPALEDVRPQVERELMNTRRQLANAAFLEGLMARYEISIDWPAGASVDDDASEP